MLYHNIWGLVLRLVLSMLASGVGFGNVTSYRLDGDVKFGARKASSLLLLGLQKEKARNGNTLGHRQPELDFPSLK